MRHPDMPKAISEDFWKTLSAGKTWVGIMKNRTKSGNFYWVETNSAPILENGKVVGFISIRVKPSREQIEAADLAYRALNKGSANIEIRQGKAVERSLFEHSISSSNCRSRPGSSRRVDRSRLCRCLARHYPGAQ
jgi:aerotaxis receptor